MGTTEVRCCHACRMPKVLLATEWKHTTWGFATHQSTRDYRCQGCGGRFTLHARTRQIALWVVGFLFLCPAGIGIPFLALAYWRHIQDGRNPVVAGAEVPAIRYRAGPPLRRCGKCRGRCVATAVTARRHNGVPTGVETVYTCTACKQRFTVESWWGHTMSSASAGAVLLLFAGLSYAADSLAWRLGFAAAGLLIPGILAWGVVRGIYAHFANPVDDALRE